ncbi:MAG: 1-deoxy-D-xylulose-5-phosphate reductoisomerase [Oscillospiraceae bacterium]|nr:1-deoxy-D-xylulose-5-phosphate reductoisomerase [Oscillospiraceae bacterium]
MVKTISLLGSTGSIGRQTLECAQRLGIPVAALAARSSTARIVEQAHKFRPKLVAVYDEDSAKAVSAALSGRGIRVVSGMEGLLEAATMAEADCVVTAVSGSVGLKPTVAAIKAGKRIALANKETLVCAGEIVMRLAAQYGAEIIPVDSEHSAIFQCLTGRGAGELKKIILTGSGGPFRGQTRAQTANKTPAEAVAHPNWSMGAKISVDSATMMNKGLEFIEAMHLFGVTPDDIEVVVHPQSVIHSAVELVDGTVIAQLGVPDMGLPIQYALTWPDRCESGADKLDLFSLKHLTFERPDFENTPCLALAMDCARRGGTAPAVMSAANEVAVGAFLRGSVTFGGIYEIVAKAVNARGSVASPTLDDVLAADAEARRYAENLLDER